MGNVDVGEIRRKLPEVARAELGGVRVVVLHGQQFGSPTAASVARRYPEADLVVFGHSHQPVIERVGRVLAVNPGSAGPARFSLPVTVAIAEIAGGEVRAERIDLLSGRVN